MVWSNSSTTGSTVNSSSSNSHHLSHHHHHHHAHLTHHHNHHSHVDVDELLVVSKDHYNKSTSSGSPVSSNGSPPLTSLVSGGSSANMPWSNTISSSCAPLEISFSSDSSCSSIKGIFYFLFHFNRVRSTF